MCSSQKTYKNLKNLIVQAMNATRINSVDDITRNLSPAMWILFYTRITLIRIQDRVHVSVQELDRAAAFHTSKGLFALYSLFSSLLCYFRSLCRLRILIQRPFRWKLMPRRKKKRNSVAGFTSRLGPFFVVVKAESCFFTGQLTRGKRD